jgi:predicted secreted protein
MSFLTARLHTLPITASLLCVGAFVVIAETSDFIGTEEQPLQVTEEASIEKARLVSLKVGEKSYLALRKNGGTGYFWDPTVSNSRVVSVITLETRSIKQLNQLTVGNPEDDVFVVQGISPGMSTVRFDLRRVKSESVQSAFLNFSVIPQ